jgi:molecular chaperone Hsp33
MSTASGDAVTRFYFPEYSLRGEWITLDASLQAASCHQSLPASAQTWLGEFLAAAGLLSGLLKYEGLLTLQLRGQGQVTLAMAEATQDKHLRGLVRLAESTTEADLSGLSLAEATQPAVLAITLDPEHGHRYQGVVPLEGNTLAGGLNFYFAQSEQLATHIWLFCDGQKAAGLFLQRLPPEGSGHTDSHRLEAHRHQQDDAWTTLLALSNTLTVHESLSLDTGTLLHRLFHEHDYRITGQATPRFVCSCSPSRSAQAVAALGADDAYTLLSERGHIDIDCQFCGRHYRLTQPDLDALFNTTQH